MKTNLSDLPLNQKVTSLLQGMGITELFPPQQLAFQTKVLQGGNLVLAFPTSSGKTLVAEICMIKSILDSGGKALYLVPLRSLAREKHLDFRKYETLGITTAMSVGDYDSPGTRLADADIIILTTERADSLIRHRPSWFNDIVILVVDEIHLVNDTTRGPTLEMVIASVRRMLPKVQIVALSATISNADQIAKWLDAELVKSNWRPVPLKEGVLLDDEIHFGDGGTRSVRRKKREDVEDLVLDILEEDGQVLVFVSNRRSTVSIARKLAPLVRPFLSQDLKDQLLSSSDRIRRGASVPESSKILADLISQGTAFHHAGLTNHERATVEDCFKKHALKVIVATPTLAAGVNLPARRVIVRDYRRFEEDTGNRPIPILEYKQMAGRAGRPKYDTYGEAILIAHSFEESDRLLEHYICSEPEEISSKLASRDALRFHLLAAIATETAHQRDEIDAVIGGTFFSLQFSQKAIRGHISSALRYLERVGLIETESGAFHATVLGHRTSRLYIDPRTAVIFRKYLPDSDSVSTLGLLQLVCHTPDQPGIYLTQADYEEYSSLAEEHSDELLVPPPSSENPRRYLKYLGELKTASLLNDWISEIPERDMTENYGVGMGDVHRYVESADWLVYSVSEISKAIGVLKPQSALYELRTRLKYGVKPDILDLVGLRGIGRIRGRMLHSHGYRTIADLYHAPLETIARVPTIGSSIAESIKKQLGAQVDSVPPDLSEEETISDADGTLQTMLDDFDEY